MPYPKEFHHIKRYDIIKTSLLNSVLPHSNLFQSTLFPHKHNGQLLMLPCTNEIMTEVHFWNNAMLLSQSCIFIWKIAHIYTHKQQQHKLFNQSDIKYLLIESIYRYMCKNFSVNGPDERCLVPLPSRNVAQKLLNH